jgi:multidrug transporter EmrE-like cation transporter
MTPDAATAIVIVALIGFVAFRQYLSHHRRIMIHRERIAAIEKGVALPPVEQEIRRSNINIQRILLLAGLVWVVLGITLFVVLSAVLVMASDKFTQDIPRGIQYAAIAPIGIGLAHLVVFFVGKNKSE